MSRQSPDENPDEFESDVQPDWVVPPLPLVSKPISAVLFTVITAACAAVVLLPTAWFFTPVEYTASAHIRILSVRPSILDAPGTIYPSDLYEKYVRTQEALITDRTILKRVLDDSSVSTLPAMAAAVDRPTFLARHVQARWIPGTELMTVTCTMPSAEAARAILQSVIDAYLYSAMNLEANGGDARLRVLMSARDYRQSELDLLRRQAYALQTTLGPVQVDGTFVVSDERSALQREKWKADGEVSRLQVALQLAEARAGEVAEFQKNYAANPEIDLSDAAIEREVDSDPEVIALTRELAKAQARAALDAAQSLDQHQNRNPSQDAIAALENKVAQTRHVARLAALQIKHKALDREVEVAKTEIAEARERASMYRDMLEASARERGQRANDYAELQDLQSRIEECRARTTDLNRLVANIRLESNAPSAIQLAAPASVPETPDYSPRIRLLIMALIVSVGLGVVVGLWVAVRRRMVGGK